MDQQVLSACAAAVQGLRLAARDARSWSPQQRRAVLGEIERLSAVLVGTRSDVLAAEQVAETWRGPGVPSLGARLGRDTGVGRGVGSVWVQQADTWGQIPVLARAAESGVITTSHVDAVGRVARSADPAVREVLTSTEAQRQLVELAMRLDAPSFAKEVARAAARLDPAGPERDHERQCRARHLHVVDAADGTRITGLVDHQAGRRLRLALEAVTPRPTQDDPRTGPQRAIDALVGLADTVLSSPDTGSGAAVRPHVSLVMSVETFAELRAAQAHRAAQGAAPTRDRTPTQGESMGVKSAGDAVDAGCSGGGAVPPLCFAAPVDPVTDEDGNVIPFSEVARILCDCALTRIVVDAAGEPVDVGRRRRLYTGAQRRAVLARDRGCAWDGCTTPARWCEIHHIAWWERDDGPTSIDNGVALCRHHHQEVHRLDLHIERHAAELPAAIGRDRVGGRGRAIGAGAGRGATMGLDPGRPTVRYTIRTRDGTPVAGGAVPPRSQGAALVTGEGGDARAGTGSEGALCQDQLPIGA